MRFYRKLINLDKVESIDWFTEHEGQTMHNVQNIAGCELYFESGHKLKAQRDQARGIWHFLQHEEEK